MEEGFKFSNAVDRYALAGFMRLRGGGASGVFGEFRRCFVEEDMKIKIKVIALLFVAVCTASFAFGTEKIKMVSVPGKNLLMAATEITQSQYEAVMKENPSAFKGKNLPAESMSWFDAIYFCNALSEAEGLVPVYSVDGKTSMGEWNYTPHGEEGLKGEIAQNLVSNGYRLPTDEEWLYAAKGGSGDEFLYAGFKNPDDAVWYAQNSGGTTHEVAKKKANGYGLYDMCGNVSEMVWQFSNSPQKHPSRRWVYGGNFTQDESHIASFCNYRTTARTKENCIGFRVVRKEK